MIIPKKLEKSWGELKIRRICPDLSNTKVNWNTEKSPEELRRGLRLDFSEGHQLILVRKLAKGSNTSYNL